MPGPTCVPSLEDDAYSTPMDTPLAVPLPAVGANDTETCGSPYALVASTTNGTLTFNADGTFLYTPNAGFIGVDQFQYTVDLPDPPTLRRRVLAGFRAPQGVPADIATVTITIEGPPPTTTTTTTTPLPDDNNSDRDNGAATAHDHRERQHPPR